MSEKKIEKIRERILLDYKNGLPVRHISKNCCKSELYVKELILEKYEKIINLQGNFKNIMVMLDDDENIIAYTIKQIFELTGYAYYKLKKNEKKLNIVYYDKIRILQEIRKNHIRNDVKIIKIPLLP